MLESLVRGAEGSGIEVCSVLIGFVRGDRYIVREYVDVRNIEVSPVLFRADPRDMARAIFKLTGGDYDIVGVFHSHPAPPVPSVRDVEGMRFWPRVVWLIYSTTTHSLGAYMFGDNGSICRVGLVVC
ncbi:MAG: M67 family metallopeptidase [Candidatus Methanomethylicia archaeon]